MNDLSMRKRLLIAQADLHRHGLERECQRLTSMLAPAPAGALPEPWWLRTAMTVGGFLLPPRWQGLLRFAPAVFRLLRP